MREDWEAQRWLAGQLPPAPVGALMAVDGHCQWRSSREAGDDRGSRPSGVDGASGLRGVAESRGDLIVRLAHPIARCHRTCAGWSYPAWNSKHVLRSDTRFWRDK